MRLGFLILIFIALTSCGEVPRLGPATEDALASASQDDCGFVQNSYGQRVSWKSQTPISLVFHPSFPQEFKNVFKKAATHWEDASGKSLFKYVEGTTANNRESQKDGVNVVSWMDSWDTAKANQQAVTSLFWYGNKIQESDINVNGKNFAFYVDDYPGNREVHLESLFVHEIGHVLGLKHRSDVTTVMWSILSAAVKRDTLTEADRITLKCEY